MKALLLFLLVGLLWLPLDKNGWYWNARASETGSLVGECRYTGTRVNGQYIHRGIFHRETDFMFGDPYEEEFDSLCDCVLWVENMALGGYYL